MEDQIRYYLNVLGVGSATPDPTIPFDNEFYLLGLDEGDSDHVIAQKAKQAAARRSEEVDKRGRANQDKRLDILLRSKIVQAGLRFDGQIAKVAEHRDALHRLRERRLKDFAKNLCDSGKWTAKEGTDLLETIASTVGVTPNRLQKAVSDAVQSAGKWLPDRIPVSASQQGTSPTSVQFIAGDFIAVGGRTISMWLFIPPIGLALGLINAWAGLAFGLAFLILALGKANAERKLKLAVAAPARHLRWGALNAAVASIPLLVLLVFQPSVTAPEARWGGEWDTDWGRMIISVNSGRVTAEYESRTGQGRADLKATNEYQLDGSWCRGSCAPPNDTGRLRLVLDDSGQAIKGWYTIGLDNEIKQSDDPAYQVNGRRKAQ